MLLTQLMRNGGGGLKQARVFVLRCLRLCVALLLGVMHTFGRVKREGCYTEKAVSPKGKLRVLFMKRQIVQPCVQRQIFVPRQV